MNGNCMGDGTVPKRSGEGCPGCGEHPLIGSDGRRGGHPGPSRRQTKEEARALLIRMLCTMGNISMEEARAYVRAMEDLVK